MEAKSLLIKELSPNINSKSSRAHIESVFHFPTIEKCRSIEKLSQNFSKNAHDKSTGRSRILLAKQNMIEMLNGIKETSEKSLRIKLAFKALEYLTKDSGVLQKELSILSQELFDAIYCEKNKIRPEIREWIYEKYDFSAYDKDNTMPLALVLDYWKDAYEKVQNAYNELSHELGRLREEHIQKITENNILKSEIESYKECSTKETFQETRNNDSYIKEKIECQIKGLNQIIDDLYGQLHQKEEIIMDCELNLKQKISECKSLKDTKKKYSEYFKNFKHELRTLKETNEKLKDKIEKLKGEKVEVEEIKSGESKANLTLRPDYECCEKLLEPCPDTSTKGRVNFLLNLISTMKLKKIKKNTTPGIKKKPSTDLQASYRKQQTCIITN